MNSELIFTQLKLDEQFLTFFACLNVFLQGDAKLDQRERNFLLNQAQKMGLNWVDAETLQSLIEKKSMSLYHARLLELSQAEREYLLRAVIAVIGEDSVRSPAEFAHLQELMSYLGLKKWDLQEFGEKLKGIQLVDLEVSKFAPQNQIIFYLAVWEFSMADHVLHANEQARIQSIFKNFEIERYDSEQRKMGLAVLVERILFGKGISHLPIAELQALATKLKQGFSENEISMLLVGIFNYHALVRTGFESILFDRIDEMQEALQLSSATTSAILDFFAISVISKKDSAKSSPLITVMKLCFSDNVSLADRKLAWDFLDSKFGFASFPKKVKEEALCVVLSAIALDGVSGRGEEIALDEAMDFLGCDPVFVKAQIEDFNKANGLKITLPEKYKMQEMRAEVRRKNLQYERTETRKKTLEFAKSWQEYIQNR